MRGNRIIWLTIWLTVLMVVSFAVVYGLNPQECFNQGLQSYRRSDFANALAKWQEGLELAQRTGNRQEEAIFLTSIGSVHRNLGDYPKALNSYKRSLKIRKEIDDSEGEGIDLINIGLVYTDLGDYSEALDCYQQSLKIRRRIGDLKGEVDVLTDIGNVYLEIGCHLEALGYLKQAQKIGMKIDDPKRQAIALNNIGVVYRDLEDYSTAVSYYRQAIDILNEYGFSSDARQTSANVADVYLEQKRFAEAFAILTRLNWPNRLGRYYLRTGDYQAAKDEFMSDIQAYEGPRNARLLVADYIGMGLALEGLGDYTGASAHYQKAAEFIERQRESLADPQRRNFFAGKVMGFSRLDPYEGLARISLKLGHLGECFFYSEHTKSRVFLDAISRRHGRRNLSIPQELSQREVELSNNIVTLYRQQEAAFHEGNRERFRSVEEQLRLLKQQQKRFVGSLRESCPEYASLRYPQPIGANDVALREDELLLEYEVTNTETIALLLRKGSILQAISIPVTRDSLARLVRQYRDFTDATNFSRLSTFDPDLGAGLYHLLIEGFGRHLIKCKRLIIIPDEILCILPFEMLISERPNKLEIVLGAKGPFHKGLRYMGDDCQISYYQSAAALTTIRSLEHSVVEKSLLAVADPVFDRVDSRLADGIPVSQVDKHQLGLERGIKQQQNENNDSARMVFLRLERTGEIAQKLQQLFGDGAKVLTGLGASESQLKNEKLDQYRYLLFATHGILDDAIPIIKEPALVLTQVMFDRPKSGVSRILSGIWQFIRGVLIWLGLISGETTAEALLQEDPTPGFLTLSEVMDMKIEAEIAALTACNTGLGKNLTGEGVMGLGRAFQYAGARAVLMSLWSVEDESTNLLTEQFFRHLKEGKDKLEALWLARSDLRRAGYEHPYYWAPFILVGER